MVAFSPEIIWRESFSFNCSISMVFQDVFSSVLKGASSSWPRCVSIVPRKSGSRQLLVHWASPAQPQVACRSSDKMRGAGNRQEVWVVDGGGSERFRYGATSISRGGNCRGQLGIVGGKSGLDAVGVAHFGRCTAGPRYDRLLAVACVVRGKASESKLNAFSSSYRRFCSFL